MRLELENVGIIKKADICCEGLTVLSGKNGTGKTTIGKVLFSIVQGGNNVEESYEHAKENYVKSSLRREVNRMRRIFPREIIDHVADPENKNNLLFLLNLGISEKIKYDLSLLEDLIARYKGMDYATFLRFHGLDDMVDQEDLYKIVVNDLVTACETCINVLNEPNSMEKYLSNRINSFLDYSFSGQIKQIDYSGNSLITCENNGSLIYKVRIPKDSLYESDSDSSFNIPYDSATFIDDPYVLDRFQNGTITFPADQDDYNAQQILCEFLDGGHPDNYFLTVERNKKMSTLFEKINEIVPGEFEVTSKEAYYVFQNKKYRVGNLAAGSKQFLILKTLLINGTLDDRSLLILDEPESHLHPEWINKFAEILVILIKDLGIHIVLSTHSPNMLLALEVYANEYGILDHSHFYLGEKEADSVVFSCIDGKVNEGYLHLSVPLIKMSIAKKKFRD